MAKVIGTTKINDKKLKIKLLKPDKPKDDRPWKGSRMIPEPFANIFLCAKKKSGKTTVISNILRACCGKKTVVWLFSGSLHRDDNWIAIKKMLDEKGIAHIDHLSVYDDKTGNDLIKEFMAMVQQPDEVPEVDVKEEKKAEPILLRVDAVDAETKGPEKPNVRTERKSKYQYVDHFMVFDDLGAALKRMKTFDTLLKTMRHWKMKIIISSQYPNDISPEARQQLNNWILFSGHPTEKLKQIYADSDIHIPWREFEKAYYFATKNKYNFLYVDRDNKEVPLRINFDEPYKISNVT